MRHHKRVLGLALFSMGTGVLLVLLIPGWGFVLAALLVLIGFWYLVV
jgi:hypothetical protein